VQSNATDNRQIASTTDEGEYLKSNIKAKEQYLRKTTEEIKELEHKTATLRDQLAVPFAQVRVLPTVRPGVPLSSE